MSSTTSDNPPKQLRVLLAAGGTGGHIFPAESLAEELVKRGHYVLFVTDKRYDTRYQGFLSTLDTARIRAGSPSGSLMNKIKGCLSLLLGLWDSRKIIKLNKPDIAVGFGGYPSFPPVFMAQKLKLPTIVHEQNALLGKVNHFLSSKVHSIASSFENMSNMLQKSGHKLVVTGNPVRESIRKLHDQPYPATDDILHLLVTGGSLGASIFADIVPGALAQLDKELLARLVITQQCSREDNQERLAAQYKEMGVKDVQLSTFFQDMDQQISKAHLVICRAGASTIMELAVAGRPAIMIPYPYALGDHQYLNAKHIEHKKGGFVYRQQECTPEILASKLKELFSDPAQLRHHADQMKQIGKVDAAEQLANQVELLVRGQ